MSGFDFGLPERQPDDFGSGHYGASRDGGARKHSGIDLESTPGDQIESKSEGRVTKTDGQVYSGDKRYKYIEITSSDGAKHRYFYVRSGLPVGTKVKKGQFIGATQNIAEKFNTDEKKMTNHIHYEIMQKNEKVDPTDYWRTHK